MRTLKALLLLSVATVAGCGEALKSAADAANASIRCLDYRASQDDYRQSQEEFHRRQMQSQLDRIEMQLQRR